MLKSNVKRSKCKSYEHTKCPEKGSQMFSQISNVFCQLKHVKKIEKSTTTSRKV